MGPVVLNQINAEIGEWLRRHPSQPRVIDASGTSTPWEIASEAEVLLTRGLSAWRGAPSAPPQENPKLKWVQVMSAGIEGYPRWLLEGRSITCGRGIASAAIAEYVLAAMLRVEKRLDRIRITSPDMWSEPSLGGLAGKSVGLLGYGSIGKEIAQRTQAFGMDTWYVRKRQKADDTSIAKPCGSLEEMVRKVDYLVVAAPLTADTFHLVDAKLLGRANKELHIINVSRGDIIDQDALVDALDKGNIGGATLDVTSPEPLPHGHPLYKDERVFLTPHISWSDPHYLDHFAAKIMSNYDAYASGRPLSDIVDPLLGY